MTLSFSQVLLAIHRADRTQTAGDIIAAATLLSVYLEQVMREKHRADVPVLN